MRRTSVHHAGTRMLLAVPLLVVGPVWSGGLLLPCSSAIADAGGAVTTTTDTGSASRSRRLIPELIALPDPTVGPGTDALDELSEQFDAAGEDLSAAGGREWVAAPIPFRSALLGYGLKLGVARLTTTESPGGQRRVGGTGVGGMYSEGGSYALALGNRRYWRDGGMRSTVGAAGGELNYELTLGESLGSRNLPVSQQVAGAIADVEWNVLQHGWIGGGLRYVRSTVTIEGLPPPVADLLPGVEFRLAGGELKGQWDTRDSELYPLEGSLSKATVNYIRADIGVRSDDFSRYGISYNGYRAIGERHVVAWRAAAEAVSGKAPFFALPWFGSGVDLRGYTPGRYIGESLVAVQAEYRWQATFRLGLVAFGGVGTVRDPPRAFDEPGWLPAAGVGLRWRLTRQNRLNFRVDYARGQDDDSLIISVGEAF